MEYWSAGVLRQLGIAPRVHGSGAPQLVPYPGLKPWANLFSHFVATATSSYADTPILQHSNTPSLHPSITPSLHHSITPRGRIRGRGRERSASRGRASTI